MKTLLKKIHTALFGVNQHPQPMLAALYGRVGVAKLAPRVMRYGRFRRLTQCLSAEAAPGTLETVLMELDALPRTATILDYGCGQAKSEYYRALGFRVAACDILPINTPDFTLINPRESRLPFADNAFDTVIASEVIEHVESPFALIEELLRVAKNGVIITTPNPQSLYSRDLFKKTGFLNWFTPTDFSYHCSPVFLWQLELFAARHKVTIAPVRGNHEVFGLKGAPKEYAESLIITIRK